MCIQAKDQDTWNCNARCGTLEVSNLLPDAISQDKKTAHARSDSIFILLQAPLPFATCGGSGEKGTAATSTYTFLVSLICFLFATSFIVLFFMNCLELVGHHIAEIAENEQNTIPSSLY